MNKQCSKCKNILASSLFSRASDRKDGLYPYCKNCVNTYAKERGYNKYKYNPDSQKKRQKAYRQTRKGKDYEKEFRSQYLSTLKGKTAKLLASSKRRAKLKGWQFDLTSEWVQNILELGKCQMTGLAFDYEVPEGQTHGDFCPSIDRTDNSLGYTQDNCKIVCLMYNRAKSEGPSDNVLLMAKSMVKLNERKT